MNVKHQLIAIITGIIAISAIGISALSILSINDVYQLYSETTNFAYAQIVSSRLLMRTLISLISFIFLIIIITIPLGLYYVRRITRPYLSIIEDFSRLASNRFKLQQQNELPQKEQQLLIRYANTLQKDVKRLNELEKVDSFKDGAKMLLHELKNPLTPLKLSIETLLVDEHVTPTVKRLHLSLLEVESILETFRTLISIEFKEKKPLHFKTFLEELFLLRSDNMYINMSFDPSIMIFSEPTLLRQILQNLLNNGLEHGNDLFHVSITQQQNHHLKIDCITPEASIPKDLNPFKIKQSSKGLDRGYGLYICKKISDYLEHPLHLTSRQNPVIFTLEVPIYDNNTHS